MCEGSSFRRRAEGGGGQAGSRSALPGTSTRARAQLTAGGGVGRPRDPPREPKSQWLPRGWAPVLFRALDRPDRGTEVEGTSGGGRGAGGVASLLLGPSCRGLERTRGAAAGRGRVERVGRWPSSPS